MIYLFKDAYQSCGHLTLAASVDFIGEASHII